LITALTDVPFLVNSPSLLARATYSLVFDGLPVLHESSLQSSLPYKLKCGLRVTVCLTFSYPSSFWWLWFRAPPWIYNIFSTCGGNYDLALKSDWLVMWL